MIPSQRFLQGRVAEPRVGRAVPVPDFPVRVLDSDNLDIPAFLRKHAKGNE